MKADVPQGNILRPILKLLMTDDLCQKYSDFSGSHYPLAVENSIEYLNLKLYIKSELQVHGITGIRRTLSAWLG